MFGRCCRLPRLVLFFTFAIALFILYQLLQIFFPNVVNNSEGERAVRCQSNDEIVKNLLDLAEKTNEILETFNVTHFVCYGTLWGALRRSKIFPWKNNFDFCVMNEDLVRLDEVFFKRQYRKNFLDIEYDSANGVYTVWKNKNGEKINYLNLYLFEELAEFKIARRIGFKHRLLPPTSEIADKFPLRLISRPLSKVKIEGKYFPAPREGVELQKYHYKDNWWQEIIPQGCSSKSA